jgi:hypothetical protein
MSWARGFEAGSRVAGDVLDTYRQAGLRRGLADEARKYNVTEGAFGPELEQNIEQVRGLMTDAQRQAAAQGGTVEDMARIEAQYMPAIDELQRRSRMTAPDFTVASRAMRPEDTFATREAATRAARPMRAEGLANVYERFGDVEQAEALRERADTARLREIQLEDAQLGLSGRRRTEAAQKRVDDFNTWRAENPGVTIQQLKDAARSQFKLTDDELLGVTANIAGLQENELKIWKNEVTDAIKGKSLDQMAELYNTDDRFDPNTDIRIGRQGGRTSVSVVDKSGKVLETKSFESDAAAREYLRIQAVEPNVLADWLLKRREIEAGIRVRDAQAEALRTGRPSTPRAPTEADVTSRARFIMDNSDPPVTQAEAITQARQQLGMTAGGADAPATGIERLVQLMEERREEERRARENQQPGLR